MGIFHFGTRLFARFQAHVRGDFVEHFEGSGSGFHGEGGQQQIVANGIDQSGNSLRTEVDLLE